MNGLKYGLLFLTYALLSQVAFAKSDFKAGTISIAGLGIGATETQVISVFGNPESRPNLTAADHAFDTKLVWPDAVAYFIDGRLEFLETTRVSACTAHHVWPGTELSVVLREIGCEATNDPEAKSLSCLDTQSACWIEVFIDRDKATKLKMQCLP